MKKTTMFRKLVEEPGFILAPASYDCLSARIVESKGFKATFMAGGAFRDVTLGIPDIGIATATEVVNHARHMANSINIPLIVDADDGYGGALAAYRTVQELIRVGAAACFIDDQKHPTKCPFMGIQEVVTRDEYFGKMGAVVEARDKEDKDFVIAARIDAAATLGDDEMIARAKGCVKLGADIINVHAVPPGAKFPVRNKEALRKLFKRMKDEVPGIVIWAHEVGFTVKDYEEVGAKMWVPGPPLAAVTKMLSDVYQGLADTGDNACYNPEGVPPRKFMDDLKGLGFWTELEKRYVID